MDARLSCLIVGCGYVGSRLARAESGRRTLLAVVRSGSSESQLRRAGVPVLRRDFDEPAGDPDARLVTAADRAAIVYLAPPPDRGTTDPRLDRFLAAIGTAVPAVFVYIGTTGVYGDTAGERVDERAPLAPATDRARRRVAAEAAVTNWCQGLGTRCVIMRVPGIYGPQRLPLERLQRAEPALREDEAGPGNRIHVDDLVAAIAAAVDRPAASGVYNVTDGDHSSTTAYLLLTATAAGLPPPPLVSRSEAADRIPAGMLSFLLESRRVDNRRLLEHLGLRLRYPTLSAGIAASLAEMRTETRHTP